MVKLDTRYFINMVAAERYLGTREFAKILGVARVTVIKWIKSGRIVAYNEDIRQEVEKV
jgi:predicted DNA-binding transcriptional regulator AlpA